MAKKISAARREDGHDKSPALGGAIGEPARLVEALPNLRLVDHSLAQHKLTYMRDAECSTNRFRQLARELGTFLAYEIMRDLPLRKADVSTPAEPTEAKIIAEKPVLVPLLRTGLLLAEGALEVIPAARIGHIGLSRSEDYGLADYLVALPEPRDRRFILMDMAIGTGDTACFAIDILKQVNVRPELISFATILIAPEGMKQLMDSHPNVSIYAIALERGLEGRYIVPGFGDAETRLFGT